MTRALVKQVAADVFTPIGAAMALAHDAPFCLLESVEHGGRISRYSFIGIDYVDARSFDAEPSLFDEMRAWIEPHRIGGETGALGGALVAFSYDAARPMARLRSRTPDAPVMPAAYAAVPASWLIFDHFTDTLTIWSCGDDIGAIERRIDGYVERMKRAAPVLPGAVASAGDVSASLDRATFLRLVDVVKRHIYDGDVYQLQLGIRFSTALEGAPFDLYRAVRRRNASPYMFYVEAPFGSLLGASPEFLVRLEGRRARIRPLAGTRPRGRSDDEDTAIAADLLGNEKERAEHVMLVDLGRNDLGMVCERGSVDVDELMQIERYSHVMHIVSDVVGRLEPGRDALDLFAAGFPAGTVTGTPKVRAMEIIDELEPVTRGFYAGSVGRFSYGGDFDSCIALRSLHVANARAWWQASAGIVADSDPAAEYEEILGKTRIAREVLGLRSGDEG